MTAQPAEPTQPEPTEPPVATATPEPPKSDPTHTEPSSNPWGDDFDAEKAWKLVQNLKQEVKDAKSASRSSAADDAKKELAQTIGKALGLVEDEPIDPAKLTESLTAAQAEAKQAQVALAVYQNASTAGGDPVALLDSQTFLKTVAGIDPTDSAAVAAAIQSAVAANPRLGASTDPRTPAPNLAQGSSAGGAPDLDAQIAAAAQAGDTRLAIHLQNQKLAQTRA